MDKTHLDININQIKFDVRQFSSSLIIDDKQLVNSRFNQYEHEAFDKMSKEYG